MEPFNAKAIPYNLDVLNHLKWEGKTIEPDQKIKYYISDYSRKKSKRAIPVNLARNDLKYDAERYSQLLDDCCNSILLPISEAIESS